MKAKGTMKLIEDFKANYNSNKLEEIHLLIQSANRLNQIIVENIEQIEVAEIKLTKLNPGSHSQTSKKINEQNKDLLFEIDNLLKIADRQLLAMQDIDFDTDTIEQYMNIVNDAINKKIS